MKAIVPSEKYKAIIWMDELDETIVYLQSMRRMLNKLSIKTNTSLQWERDIRKKIKEGKFPKPDKILKKISK